jgi:hypothetical protein
VSAAAPRVVPWTNGGRLGWCPRRYCSWAKGVTGRELPGLMQAAQSSHPAVDAAGDRSGRTATVPAPQGHATAAATDRWRRGDRIVAKAVALTRVSDSWGSKTLSGLGRGLPGFRTMPGAFALTGRRSFAARERQRGSATIVFARAGLGTATASAGRTARSRFRSARPRNPQSQPAPRSRARCPRA